MPPRKDRWIVIACDDESWPRLVALADLPSDWTTLDEAARRGRAPEIEDALASWTAGQDPGELTERLQGAGVAAHPVQHSTEVCADPQLLHRGYLQEVPHPHHGTVHVEGAQVQWSRTQARARRFAGPPVGHHTQFVLEELLGYDTDRIADLVIAGAIG